MIKIFNRFKQPKKTKNNPFDALGLSDDILRALTEKGYQTPTAIQEKAIPEILSGHDVLAAAQTGTGKTAGFTLPMLQKLSLSEVGDKQRDIRALILTPTRELAAQILESIVTYGEHVDLSSMAVFGGVNINPQKQRLRRGIDILVATPGRLLDLVQQRSLDLKTIEFLVLDEADRMLDMGFLPDVRKIVKRTPRKRQTLFFSATMPSAIESLAQWALTNPKEVEIGKRQSVAETINHAFYPVAIGQREELLMELLKQTHFKSVMIFTRTKKDADSLASNIKKQEPDYSITVMHSDIRQKDREKALDGFKDGKFDVIIATDLAARGIDISNVSHVINYQVPENAEDYVHRIGRTGRANREGDAFTLLSADELDHAKAVEGYIDQKIEKRKLDNFNYQYTTLLDEDAPTPEKLAKIFRSKKRGGSRRRRR